MPRAAALRKIAPMLVVSTTESMTAMRRALVHTCSTDGNCGRRMAQSTPRVRVYPVSRLSSSRELLSRLTGYTLTRGVLCAMRRPQLPTVAQVCATARRVAVIDSVVDTTNIGAIFRSAAALGIDAVLLTRQSCDPLNRRSVRVSMGTVFLVPWTWIDGDITATLHQYGFSTAAMALTDRSIPIDHPTLAAQDKLAIILGTEGDGLAREVISAADFTARIPMAHGVDSLNVAAAAAVAFWQLRTNP